MTNIPNEITELIHKYIEENGKRPRPFNYDQWNNWNEYKEYLEKELKKQHLQKVSVIFYGKEYRCYTYYYY